MAFQIHKATKKKSKLRAALVGPGGSGKTWSSLEMATHFVERLLKESPELAKTHKRILVIDSEHGSSEKYAGTFDFDAITLTSFSPDTYVEAIELAEEEKYLVTIIDSLSHAWSGKDGALEQVDKKAKGAGGSFSAWRDVTPMHNRLVDKILGCNTHLFATMRVKTEFVVTKDEKGKTTVTKLGLAPIQREGLEYEFDVVGDLDDNNVWTISKTRCPPLKGQAIPKPGKKVANVLLDWLTDGVEVLEAPPPTVDQIDRMKEHFASIEINDAKIEAFIGHGLGAMTASDFADLRGIAKDIKSGNKTWAQVFAERHPDAKPIAPGVPAHTPPALTSTPPPTTAAPTTTAAPPAGTPAPAKVDTSKAEAIANAPTSGELDAPKPPPPVTETPAPTTAAPTTTAAPAAPAAHATALPPNATIFDRLNACQYKEQVRELRSNIAAMPGGAKATPEENKSKSEAQALYNQLKEKLPLSPQR